VEGKSIFISSCSRRQLARRRPANYMLRLQVAIAVLVIAAAIGTFFAARGGM
jgi:hypothetical protein